MKLSTHFYRLQPHSISCSFKIEKVKYITVRRLCHDKCVIIHTCNSVVKEFKRHARLLPHKFTRITCNKYRNASEIQFTSYKQGFSYIQTKYSKPANAPHHIPDAVPRYHVRAPHHVSCHLIGGFQLYIYNFFT